MMLRLRARSRARPLGSAVPVGLRPLLLLALTTAGLPSEGFAQAPLVGVVTDRETSAPLPGVLVVLEGRAGEAGGAAALTDESGRFVLPAEGGTIYRLRAERVGLATELTDWFTFEERAPPRRIALAERALELEGLNVSAPVRTCRLEPRAATVVQRWWDEVRKALSATAFVEATDAAMLRFERFEREWTPNLRALRAERLLPTDSVSSRPFLSQDAETLSERGFVQGVEGERWFLAPDARVLFSDVFLAEHCLGIADEDRAEDASVGRAAERPGELRMAVEPTRLSTPDIRGVLTVDTISGALRSFDFEYANLPNDVPRNEAGGHLTFRYLPSGAWIVSDWWIRLPQIGYQSGWRGLGRTAVVLGYLDRGGRVVEVGGRGAALDAAVGRGSVRGVVYDSLTGGPLVGARVSIVGSRLSTRTGRAGRFTLVDVPTGHHSVTFHHPELTRMGLPSPVRGVQIADGVSDSVALSTPGFATAVAWFCDDMTGRPSAVLAGTVLEAAGGEPAPVAAVRATWVDGGEVGDGSGVGRSRWTERWSDPDGRYALCDLPSDLPVMLAVRTDSGAWKDAGTVELEEGHVVVRELRPGVEASAVVRGMVRAAAGGTPIAGAEVSLHRVDGDEVARARSDSAGAFRMFVPAAVGYRVVASGAGYARRVSSPFAVTSAESLDVEFELALTSTGPSADRAMEIEGLMVAVEGRAEAVAQRLLNLYGHSPESLGRRWIDRASLDSIAMSGDPGIAIREQGIPGVWVQEGLKWGLDAELCVTHARASPGGGSYRCAMILFNGVKIDPQAALGIDFRELEAIAVLSPSDATTFYGTEAGGGAVLLWSR